MTNRLLIPLLVDLSADLSTTGGDMKDSFLSVFERRRPELLDKGLDLDIRVDNYAGEPQQAVLACQRRYSEGAVTIVGPCDSAAAHAILTSELELNCPVISPLATGTKLTALGATNFFRMTSPDRVRATLLIRTLRELYPRGRSYVYSFSDSDWSYSQLLKNDVLAALERSGLTWYSEDFSSSSIPSVVPSADCPIVACGPSNQVVRLVRDLREKGVRSQVFTFGSNSNLLVPAMRNSLTVSDVDPEDTNPAVRQEIERLTSDGKPSTRVSVSTLNCAAVIINLLLRVADSIAVGDLVELRKTLLADLRTSPQEGLLGRFAFSSDGEMIGSEHLAVLQVARSFSGVQFRHLRGSRKRQPLSQVRWGRLVMWIFGLVSFLVAAIQLILWVTG